MDTILFPITVMHFYSYSRHILEYTRGMFLTCARADVKAVSDFFFHLFGGFRRDGD